MGLIISEYENSYMHLSEVDAKKSSKIVSGRVKKTNPVQI